MYKLNYKPKKHTKILNTIKCNHCLFVFSFISFSFDYRYNGEVGDVVVGRIADVSMQYLIQRPVSPLYSQKNSC